jgi:hypothetical protein
MGEGARPVTAPGWVVEGVLLCPGCTLFLEFTGTPEDLQKAIDEHEGLDH